MPGEPSLSGTGEAEPEGYKAEPVHVQFERWVAQRPDSVACYFDDQLLTYRQLDERSNQLANHLISAGVSEGNAIAVCLSPSIHQLVAILGIFKAGGFYVPINPTYPPAMVLQILEEAPPAIVLTQSELAETCYPALYPQLHLDNFEEVFAASDATTPKLEVDVHQRCYLLFTSGTTGRPKGVGATHNNLAHYLRVAREAYGFCHEDKFCSTTPYTFSISLFEILSPLCCGASVQLLSRENVLDPQRFARVLEDVTVVHTGPSLLSSLFRYLKENPRAPRSFPRMRHASSGGDIFAPYVAEEMKRVFNNAEIFIIYGCTEISCMGCSYPVERDNTMTRSYVGKPFAAVDVRILDRSRNPVPISVTGEICFTGAGVFPGYLNQPELDSQSFIYIGGQRFYQTGDLGRFDAEGNIEILGRRDFQVQIRGIRLELTGIENVVRELNLAPQCVVVLKKLDDQDVRLVAFVVDPSEKRIEVFRRAVAARLPDYMVPQHLVVVDQLPLTANGKLDRRALQNWSWESESDAESHTPPRNVLEEKIARAFRSALELRQEAQLGIDDNFFDLGGHSLLAVLLTDQLENILGSEVPAGTVFEAPTVRTLAAYIQLSAPKLHRPILLSRHDNDPALFLIAGVHLYRDLARQLDGSYSVYGVYAESELSIFDEDIAAPPIATLATQYLEIIRRTQPQGPYHLGGISFGGIVVYEIAQQLRGQGERVAYLALLDAMLTQKGLRGRFAQLRRLVGLGPRGAVQYLYKRLVRQRGQMSSLGRIAEFGQIDGRKLGLMENLREEAYETAAREYASAVEDWPLSATVITAGKRLADNPLQPDDCGWSEYVSDLGAHVIDAQHLELLQEPWVEQVAEIMSLDLLETGQNRVETSYAEPGDATTQ